MTDSLNLMISAIPVLASACWLTVVITVSGFALGQVLALPIALGRGAKFKAVRLVTFGYTFALRGSPLLVQLFIVYYGLSQIALLRESFLWAIFREPVYCAVLAIGINSSAYMAELLRGAIDRLAKGQREAAEALGLKGTQVLALVVLPQAYRAILPVISNEFILVLKASALASTVTMMELTGAARSLVTKTYAPFEIFTAAGVFYLALGLLAAYGFNALERHISPERRRA